MYQSLLRKEKCNNAEHELQLQRWQMETLEVE